MKKKTATIIGATGLIGSELLNLLKNDEEYSEVRILARRPLETEHPKVNVKVIDFTDNEAYKTAISGSDVVFCAIGTTSKKVKGNKQEYRKIDFDIPANAAKYCVETGCKKFIFVSSVGASSKSSNFYLSLKGEVEAAIEAIDVRTAIAFRPSLLLGKRNEFRFGELIGKYVIVPLSVFFPSQMKPIKAQTVAKAMLQVSKEHLMGYNVLHRKEMKLLANRYK
jgi:uncharacterized protein YbjT (DUF2867 family)